MISTVAEFRALLESDAPEDRRQAAFDRAPDALWRAVIAEAPDLRFWVAHNRAVPAAVLADLAADPDPQVRARVAMRRAIPEALQELLARDGNEGFRIRLAWNAAASPAVLGLLAADPSPLVHDPARQRLAGKSPEGHGRTV